MTARARLLDQVEQWCREFGVTATAEQQAAMASALAELYEPAALAPPPADSWRLLASGEAVQPGDEFWSSDTRAWTVFSELELGRRGDPVRRRLAGGGTSELREAALTAKQFIGEIPYQVLERWREGKGQLGVDVIRMIERALGLRK